MIVSTQLIVLEKSPYRESALIVRGITPDYGKTAFVAHRAQKISGREFPEIDIFRELELEFKDDHRGELFTPDRVEMTAQFDAISNHPKNFILAGKIASFLLRNLVDNVPQPYTYDVFRSVLCQLSTDEPEWSLEQCAVVFKTAYLYENGLLPESRDPRVNEFIENIVASGIENSPLPDCSHDYWRKLHLWLNRIIDYHKLRR